MGSLWVNTWKLRCRMLCYTTLNVFLSVWVHEFALRSSHLLGSLFSRTHVTDNSHQLDSSERLWVFRLYTSCSLEKFLSWKWYRSISSLLNGVMTLYELFMVYFIVFTVVSYCHNPLMIPSIHLNGNDLVLSYHPHLIISCVRNFVIQVLYIMLSLLLLWGLIGNGNTVFLCTIQIISMENLAWGFTM